MTGYTNQNRDAINDESNHQESGAPNESPILGIIAKSASVILPVTEGKNTVSGGAEKTPAGREAKSADSVLWRYVLQSQARKLLKGHRVGECARKIIPLVKSVKIVRERSNKRVGYRNLIRCGLLWACPVCASKITERRSQELQKAVARWHRDDGFVIFATYTMQHSGRATLQDSLDILSNGLRRFKSGRAYQTMIESFGIVGTVKALEITYGDNGWHPHVHELIFVRPLSGRATKEFINQSRARWIESLRAVGGDGLPNKAYTAKTANSEIYDYVTKFGKQPTGIGWTIEREIVKAPAKLARRDGLTPFQMLEASMSEVRFESRFVEYVHTMHGVRQLVWSKGLKETLGVDEESDETIAGDNEQEESAFDVLATIDAPDWYYMLNSSRFADVRTELLKIAATGNEDALRDFIASFYESNHREALRTTFFDQKFDD